MINIVTCTLYSDFVMAPYTKCDPSSIVDIVTLIHFVGSQRTPF